MVCFGCSFSAYRWKLPAYSGAFYLQLTILAFLLTVGAFSLTILAFFTYNWSFFAYSGKSACNKRLKGL